MNCTTSSLHHYHPNTVLTPPPSSCSLLFHYSPFQWWWWWWGRSRMCEGHGQQARSSSAGVFILGSVQSRFRDVASPSLTHTCSLAPSCTPLSRVAARPLNSTSNSRSLPLLASLLFTNSGPRRGGDVIAPRPASQSAPRPATHTTC